MQRGVSRMYQHSGRMNFVLHTEADSLFQNALISFEEVEPASEKLLKATGSGLTLKVTNFYPTKQIKVTATYPDPGVPVSLFRFHPSLKRYLVVAHPEKRGGKNYYDFFIKEGGIFVQMQDLSPPVIGRPMMFHKPDQKNGNFFIREYVAREIGSGINLKKTKVLWNGKPHPFRWENDRQVFVVEIPEELAPGLLSIQTIDRGENLSPWFFDFVGIE